MITTIIAIALAASGIGTATHAEKVCEPTSSPYFYQCGIEQDGVMHDPILLNVPNKHEKPIYPELTEKDGKAYVTACKAEGAKGPCVWVGTRMGNGVGKSYYVSTHHGQTAIYYVTKARAIHILNSHHI